MSSEGITAYSYDLGSADAKDLVTELDGISKALGRKLRCSNHDFFHGGANAIMSVGLVNAPASRRGTGQSVTAHTRHNAEYRNYGMQGDSARVLVERLKADVMLGQVQIDSTNGYITDIRFITKHGTVRMRSLGGSTMGDHWRHFCKVICAYVGADMGIIR